MKRFLIFVLASTSAAAQTSPLSALTTPLPPIVQIYKPVRLPSPDANLNAAVALCDAHMTPPVGVSSIYPMAIQSFWQTGWEACAAVMAQWPAAYAGVPRATADQAVVTAFLAGR